MNFANQVMCLLASIDNTLLVMSESLHLVHLVVIFRHMYNNGGIHSLACVRCFTFTCQLHDSEFENFLSPNYSKFAVECK